MTADVRWRMEDGLDRYAEPYDPRRPVVCCDERPYQLVADVQAPLPMEPGRPQRVDDAYERQGCCNLFLIFQPLTGWREVHVTERRTSDDCVVSGLPAGGSPTVDAEGGVSFHAEARELAEYGGDRILHPGAPVSGLAAAG